MKNEKLNKDLNSFFNLYPKFERIRDKKNRYYFLRGEIDVCDIRGNYLNTFEIDIIIDINSYPYTVPIVKERSKIIFRDMDWHISKQGICCLDMDHNLLKIAQRGINLSKFFQNKIYPFFCNTVYKMEYKKYSNGEYPHDFEGIISFYENELDLNDQHLIVEILKAINIGKTPGRNQFCICKEDKYKKCKHFSSIEFLKSLPKFRILNDLKGFEENFHKESA